MSSMPMSTQTSPTVKDRWRALRFTARLPLLLLHLFINLPITVLIIASPARKLRWGNEQLSHAAVRWWSAGMIRIFGMRVRRFGTPLHGGVLFVANHVSWIDIEVLHGQKFMGFVAKAEIARWPLVGWLASLGGTIYHHRGSQDSLHGVMHQMVARLQQGQAVAVFPEGRTNRGDKLGVFHARIFQPAVLAEVPAQPVALKYGPKGDAQSIVAFAEGEHFMGNFIRLLGEPSRSVEVHFLEPVSPNGDGRRVIAQLCRDQIEAAMQKG